MSLLPLVTVTGFLGKAEDFAFLSPSKAFHPYSFSILDFKAFAQELCGHAPSGSALLAYSMGGRLALHALLSNPSHFSKAIIVSAHPGLNCLQEKQRRVQSDAVWAQGFLNDPWDILMAKWESQEVFRSSKFLLQRKEVDFDRRALADCLVYYSLGLQDDLRSALQNLQIPLLWMVGEKDEKYITLSKNLHFAHPESRVLTIPDAGHRIPWEQTALFQKAVYSFLLRS